jgi:hypothetical protein
MYKIFLSHTINYQQVSITFPIMIRVAHKSTNNTTHCQMVQMEPRNVMIIVSHSHMVTEGELTYYRKQIKFSC